jgi:hypothetical protein
MLSIKLVAIFAFLVCSSALPHERTLQNNPVLTADEDADLTVVCIGYGKLPLYQRQQF